MVIDYLGTKNPDFIGDINGHFDTLIKLFDKLGYKKSNGMYSHPDITVLICGEKGINCVDSVKGGFKTKFLNFVSCHFLV